MILPADDHGFCGAASAKGPAPDPAREWDSPVQRLCDLGPLALSLPELLSILLGPPGADGTDEAVRIMTAFARDDGSGPLRELAGSTPAETARRAGIRLREAARILAAVEVGRRAMEERHPRRLRLRTAAEVHAFMRPRMGNLPQEECHAILLNVRREALRRVPIAVGTLDACLFGPRDVFRPAILERSSSIILVRNHPSGNPAPSRGDRAITRDLRRTGELIGIPLRDHVIIAGERWFSFREAGELGAKR